MPGFARTDTFNTSDGCTIWMKLREARRSDPPRLALVHPLGLNETIWKDVIDALADRVHVLTYDCRGHGRSERRAMPYTTDLFARDLNELLDHVGWTTAVVAGCSMGGCVAQAFACNYPQRVTALGLVDTTAWYGSDAPRKWRERATVARTDGLAGMTEFQVTRWFSDSFRSLHPETVSATNAIFLANDLECYSETCLMLGDADLRPLQSQIRVPVAIVVGEEDFATPVAMARQIHESVAGSTLRVIPNVRHLAPLEAPQVIASELLALVERVAVGVDSH